jgi:CHASE3 domain sensor protein
MPENQFRYLVLIIFLSSILLIVYLQFNSGRSIENLINGNKNLLKELETQAKLKELEKDIILVESSIRGFVITEDSIHLQGLTPEIAKIESELRTIRTTLDDSSQLVDQLSFLAAEKLEHNRNVMRLFSQRERQRLNLSSIPTGERKFATASLIQLTNSA